MTILYTNGASALLASDIDSTQTSLSISAGYGALFPDPDYAGSGEYFVAAIEDSSGNIEYVQVTARSTDTFTIVRGFDNSTGTAFTAGARVELRVTAHVYEQIDTDIASKAALVTGTVDHIATLDGAGELQDSGIDLSGISQTELDILDGATVSTSELNTLTGITASTTELNLLTGLTSTTAELDALHGLTPTRVVVTDGSGYADVSTVTPTELALLGGLTLLKQSVKDHGTKTGAYTIQLDEADLHIIECGATLTLTIASTNTNDKGVIAIHNNGGYTISLSGIDNDSPTLTVGTNVQDFVGVVKSHGYITCVASKLNQPAA